MYSTPSGADQAIRQASTTHRHIPTTHPKRLQTTSPLAAFSIVVIFLSGRRPGSDNMAPNPVSRGAEEPRIASLDHAGLP